MSKKLSLVLAAVVASLLVAPIVFFSFSTRPVITDAIGVSYTLGEEIENYPVPELSTNFTSWNMTTKLHESGIQFDIGSEALLVFVNFTLRNTTNKTVNLLAQRVTEELSSMHIPPLWYEGQTPKGNYVSGPIEDVEITGSWLNHLYPDETGLLNANETARGILVYMMPKSFRALGLNINYSNNLVIFVDLITPATDSAIG